MSTVELDTRTVGGIRTDLRWEPPTDPDGTGTLYLVTLDLGTEEETTLAIAPENARDAFEHPGFYGALRCKCAQCSGGSGETDDDEYADDIETADDEAIPF